MLGVILAFLLLLAGSFKLGRVIERRALTEFFSLAIEQTYWEAYKDTTKACREGRIK